MGIKCRIIKNKQGQVQYVEAPNGNRSQLYDDAKTVVGENEALDIVLTAYTPSFTEEVRNPKISEFRRQLVDRINNLPSTSEVINVNLDGIDYNLDPSTLEMTTEDLGNGETLLSFTADLNSVPVETNEVVEEPIISAPNILGEIVNRLKNTGLSDNVEIISEEELKNKLKGSGIKLQQGINGFVLNNEVFINRDRASLDTPIHEFGHLWNSWMQQNAPEVFNKGIDLIRTQGQEYVDFVNENQPNLEGDAIYEEALAQAIGDNGARLLKETSKKSFVDWLKEVWDSLKGTLGLANTSLEEFQNLTVNQFAERAAVDILSGESLSDLMNSETGTVGEAFTVKQDSELSPLNKDTRFDYSSVDFTRELPRRSLQDVIEEYEGRVFFITSDATGVKLDSQGDPVYGGVGYMAIRDNIDGNIGFASLDKRAALSTVRKIHNRYGDNQKVAVMVMVQNPSVTVGNYYGAKYFGRGLKELQKEDSENYSSMVDDIVRVIEKNKKINSELKKQGTKEQLINAIRNVNDYTESEFASEFIKDSTFNARTAILGSLLIENPEIRTDKTTPSIKVALRDKGFNRLEFLKEYGDDTIFDEEMYNSNQGGFLAGGFEIEIPSESNVNTLVEDSATQGLEHPQFNGKVPTTDKSFFLDGLYPVQENFVNYAQLQTTINTDNISPQEISNLVQKNFKKDSSYNNKIVKRGKNYVPKKERTYKHLSTGNKIKFKEILAELDPNNLKPKQPNVVAEVARGFGFSPEETSGRSNLVNDSSNLVRFSISKQEAEEQTDLYLERINNQIESNPDQYWSVDVPSRSQILDAALNDRLVDVNGGMGIVTEDGNMEGLFKYDDSKTGTAASVQKERIEKGGIKLDNYDGYLTDLYTKNGFRVVSRLPFNEGLAPENWDESKHGTPDVVFMVYDPKGELSIEEKTFNKDEYNSALDYRDSFIEQAKEIHPFYRKGLTINKTGETQGFFSDVVTGKSDKFKAKKEWTPILPFNNREQEFKSTYDKFKGNFDNHIATSIPTFRETQIKVGSAITDMFKNETNPLVYDIGGSEGGFVKAITEESDGNIKSINLDLNSDMQDAHNKQPVKGSKFILEAFYEGYTDEDTGVTYKRHIPKEKADVVHESMVFQFISPEREGFIKEVKDNYLKEDGIALFEEKLSSYNEAVWLENERVKNTYKSIYYSQEALTQKSEEVLAGMKKNQTYREEFLKILNREFDFVEEYWDAGNFKGYLATNSKDRRDEFLSKIGGRISSQYSENQTKPKFSVGFVQTKQRPEGNQVILSNVDNRIQGQGLGTEMYKQVASSMTQQGETLLSDFNNKGAEGIWDKLSQEGIVENVTVDGKVVQRVRTTPESFDTNGEPSVNEVIQYIQSKNYEGQSLSEEEVNEVRNTMLGTTFKSSEELYKALRRALTPNDIFNPSEDSLVNSGLYSKVEARRLLDNEDNQIKAYEFLQKLKNTDIIDNNYSIDNSYLTLTSDYNSIGVGIKENPFINEKRAVEKLGGIKNENIFSNQVDAYDLNFAANKFNELSKYNKISEFTVDGGLLRRTTSIDNLRSKFEETVTSPSNNKLIDELDYLLDVPVEIWNMNFKDIQESLKQVEKNAADIGLDLTTLSEEAYDKNPTEVKNMLNAVRNFTNIQNEATFDILFDEYVNFFGIESRPNSRTLKISTDNRTLISLDSNLDPYTLFNEHGLLPLGNNIYQKVNKDKSLEGVVDIIYQMAQTNQSILPESAFRGGFDGLTLDSNYVTNPNNENFVKRDIRNFAQERSKDIEYPSQFSTEELQKMVLFSQYFNTNINNSKSNPSILNETDLIINYPENSVYLQTEFIADFNKKMLREKNKNSESYKKFYSNFDISYKGIELINTDPITLNEMKPFLTSDIVNYFRLRKDGFNLGESDTNNLEETNDIMEMNYYRNFPEEVEKFKGSYQIDKSTLVTDTNNKNFIRTPQGLFMYVETVGSKSLYSRIRTTEGNYKIYDNNLEIPQVENLEKYNVIKGVDANKKINNLYSEAQNKKITNEIDNC